jgi:hypothetical protein
MASAKGSENTSRLQDITLQPEYLSFSQSVPEDIDGRSDVFDRELSVEVGRDQMLAREFTPGLDDNSLREKSVGPEDPLLNDDPAFNLAVGNDDALNFDFDLPPMDFDAPFNPDFHDFDDVPMPDFEIPLYCFALMIGMISIRKNLLQNLSQEMKPLV